MTDNSSSRLDRLEALADKILEDLQETRKGLQETREGLQETRDIANSNARTIQALMEQQTTERLKHEETMAEMKQILAKAVQTQESLTRILISLDEDRPTILRRLMKIEDKVDRLLERAEK